MSQSHRSNDITSGVLHLIGVGLAIAVLVVLVIEGARHGSPWHIVSYTLYGTGLVLLYTASATYHLIHHQKVRLKHIFQRLDHAMIYILIASTYTPITFIALEGGWRWSMFGIIWGIALFGFIVKIMWLKIPSWILTLLYPVMGWIIVIAFAPLLEGMSTGTVWLLFTGGVSYTVGVFIYALDHVFHPRKYFWMHEIFHLFVLGGSALHTIMMFYLL